MRISEVLSIASCIALALLPVLALTSSVELEVYGSGENWLTGWSYRKSHLILNATGAGTNYQVSITCYYGSGSDSGAKVYLNSHSQTNFADLRFADDENSLLFAWNETQYNGLNITVWVKINDDLSSNNATLYLYYGNPTAEAYWDGTNTFNFFDDFMGDSLNLTKWIVREGEVTVSDSQLILAGTIGTRGRIDGLTSFNPNTAIYAKSRCSDPPKEYVQLISARDGVVFSNDIILYRQGGVWWLHNEANDVSQDVSCGAIMYAPTQMHIYKIFWTTITVLQQDDNGTVTLTTNVPTVPLVYYYREGTEVGGDVYVDWVFVRKYVNPEPSQSIWGSEELSSNPETNNSRWIGIASPHIFAAVTVWSLAMIIGIGAVLAKGDITDLPFVILIGIALLICLFITLPVMSPFLRL